MFNSTLAIWSEIIHLTERVRWKMYFARVNNDFLGRKKKKWRFGRKARWIVSRVPLFSLEKRTYRRRNNGLRVGGVGTGTRPEAVGKQPRKQTTEVAFLRWEQKEKKIRKAPISRRGVAVSVDGRNNGFIGARLKRHLLVCPFPSFFQTCSPFLLNF